MAPSDAHNGADVRLDELRIQKKILTWFPTHDYAQLNDIVARWSSVRTLWDAPVGDVSRYFGERVGFYFGFLEHYVHWLWVPALVGVIIYIQDQANKPSSGYLLFVGFAMAIWSTLFMETWKRKQRYFALKWGTTEYLKYEPVRPEFEANARRVRSFVDGKPSFAFDPIRFRARFTVSMVMTLTLLGVVAVAAISIFWLRVVLNRSSKSRGGSIPDGWPNHITSIIVRATG
ncbi:MAG: hypothetical protein EOO65_03215 [Methanosarcinales archaeon]|nr:MAG: hypothetical protein EOO65_03215 [Methanosarcinales archaeon]